MGNTYIGPSFSKNGILQSFSATLWRTRAQDDSPSPEKGSGYNTLPPGTPDRINRPPDPVKIQETEVKPVSDLSPQKPPKKPRHVKRVSSAGLR